MSKLHMRDKARARPVCGKLPSFHTRPDLTNTKTLVTCQVCKLIIKRRMEQLVKEFL